MYVSVSAKYPLTDENKDLYSKIQWEVVYLTRVNGTVIENFAVTDYDGLLALASDSRAAIIRSSAKPYWRQFNNKNKKKPNKPKNKEHYDDPFEAIFAGIQLQDL